MRPIVTPFELEVALQVEPDWTGKYVLDFEELLAGAQEKTPELQKGKTGSDEEEDEDEDRPVFSLVSGKYRQAKQYGGGMSLPRAHVFPLIRCRATYTARDNVFEPSRDYSRFRGCIDKATRQCGGRIPQRAYLSRVRATLRGRCTRRARARENRKSSRI